VPLACLNNASVFSGNLSITNYDRPNEYTPEPRTTCPINDICVKATGNSSSYSHSFKRINPLLSHEGGAQLPNVLHSDKLDSNLVSVSTFAHEGFTSVSDIGSYTIPSSQFQRSKHVTWVTFNS
jgi:hypothetical protein